MSLLQLRRQSSVKEIINKSKKIQKSQSKPRGSNSIIGRIQDVCQQVQSRLGKYSDQFELITSLDKLKQYIDHAIQNNIIAIDTETTGLDPISDRIVGVCLYTYDDKAAYVPINHISYISNTRLDNQLDSSQVANEFQRLVDNNVKIIMFNAKFDIRVIRHQLGVYLTPSHCGYIAGRCLKENEEESNLKYLWKKYCSDNKEEEHFTFDKMFEGIRFDLIPLNTAYLYAAKDAKMTMDLYDFQNPYLTEDNELCIKAGLTKLAKLYKDIELPIINIVADIEDNGICLDLDYCNKLSSEYNNILESQKQLFYKELQNYQEQIDNFKLLNRDSKIESPLNISSPVQLAELFYDVLKLPSVSKKQPRGTGEDILKILDHPLSKLILDYRGTSKLLTTYIDKMPNILNPITKKIHCNFNSYGADTGRFSSNNPNLQNIPSHDKKIRRMFMSTKNINTKSHNSILNLLLEDEVLTLNGYKNCQDLQINDTLCGSNLQDCASVISINIDHNNVFIQLDKEIDIQVRRLHVLVGSDFSQQEPKITAHMSNDEKFISDCAKGKDAYATIASIAFNVPYEDCLEFYVDSNGHSTNKVNPEGKERRGKAKVILLGICYGKTIKSIAEDLGVSEEKATEIYNAVLYNIPGLKHFMDESQDMARQLGYVEDNWGRRRHIPDMQLEPYEIISEGTKSFDPFFDSKELGVLDETEILKQKYKQELIESKFYSQKQKIKEKALKDGFKIKDNTKKIDDATRLCVNSRIQGSAATQSKIALKIIGSNQRLKELQFRMLILVHDEIIGEVPFINAKEAIPLFIQGMLDSAKDLKTGAKCDASIVLNWYGSEIDLEDLTLDKLRQLKKEVYQVQ